MKFAFIILSLLGMSMTASAATSKITCTFTEPFFEMQYNLETMTAIWTGIDWDSPTQETISKEVASNIKLVPDMSDPLLPEYFILDEAGTGIASLSMDFNGSNGMSDTVYPLSIVLLANAPGNNSTYEQEGGCVTDLLTAVDPQVEAEEMN